MDKFKLKSKEYLEKKLHNAQDVQVEQEAAEAHEAFEVHEAQKAQEVHETHHEHETQAVHEAQDVGNVRDEIVSLTSTQGRKGKKLKRINMAFTDPNYDFIKKQSRRDGKSITEYINDIIDLKRQEAVR